VNNFILGNIGNNILSGELADDTLVGDQGNDWLQGGAGKDSLTGVDLTFRGVREIDQLTGGADADVFVLGDSTDYFYKGYLDDDYALIMDAGTGSDKVMLKGAPVNYRIEAAVSSRLGGVTGAGLYIYVDNPVPVTAVMGTTGTEDDLIAFLSAPAGSYTLTFMGVS
jgi:Ca2+-binding RTX toxin-like protein